MLCLSRPFFTWAVRLIATGLLVTSGVACDWKFNRSNSKAPGGSGSSSDSSSSSSTLSLRVSGSEDIFSNVCSTFYVDLVDSSGNIQTASSSISLDITNVLGDAISSSSACDTPINSVSIPSGQSRAKIYYRSSFTGTSGLSFSASQVNSQSFSFDVLTPNPSGSLDTTFGISGTVTPSFGSGLDVANALAIQPDGKIVQAGQSPTSSFGLARFNSNGSLDTAFGTSGIVTTQIELSFNEAFAVAVQLDGKIVAAGRSGSPSHFALARYNSNGSLDATFGTGGIVTTDIGTANGRANGIAIQSDGKIVLAGQASNGSNDDFALARYNSNGSLDTTFDSDGKVTTAVGSSTDRAFALAIQPDGKIVAAGFSTAADNDVALVRYNSDGSLDATFDTDGIVTTAIGSATDRAYALALQSDGKIVAAGVSNNGTHTTTLRLSDITQMALSIRPLVPLE